MPKATTTRKKGKKQGRNKLKPDNQRYLAERRWVKNKAKRVTKQMRKFPNYKPVNLSDEVSKLVKKLV